MGDIVANGGNQTVEGARDVLEFLVSFACGWYGTSNNTTSQNVSKVGGRIGIQNT